MAEATGQKGGRLSGLVPLVVVGIVVVLFARSCLQNLTLGGGDRPDRTDLQQAPVDEDDPDLDPEAQADGPAPPPTPDVTPGQLEPRDPECPAEGGEDERHLQWTGPPPRCIDEARDYVAVLDTTRGPIEIELDAENAPIAVNNFVFLARWRYYDGVDFHIVFPESSLQAGLPLGLEGDILDPGYTIEDELPEDEPYYPMYSVTMGNTGRPDTNGSVFVIQTKPESEPERAYTRFGQITDPDSQAVVDAIDATGIARAGHDGTPRVGEETTIRTVTIEER